MLGQVPWFLSLRIVHLNEKQILQWKNNNLVMFVFLTCLVKTLKDSSNLQTHELMNEISLHPYLYVTAMAPTYDKSLLAEFRKSHSSAVNINKCYQGKKYFLLPGIENIIESVGCLRGLFMLKYISEVKYILLIFLF